LHKAKRLKSDNASARQAEPRLVQEYKQLGGLRQRKFLKGGEHQDEVNKNKEGIIFGK
jgi:hypothetical protein